MRMAKWSVNRGWDERYGNGDGDVDHVRDDVKLNGSGSCIVLLVIRFRHGRDISVVRHCNE